MNPQKPTQRFYVLLVIVLLIGTVTSLVQVTGGHAASTVTCAPGTICVNTTQDTVSNDGTCSLREAIIAANTGKASGGKNGECVLSSGSNVIQLQPTTYNLTRTDNGNEDSAQTGDLDIKSNVTIQVSGGQATIQAQLFHDRIFQIFSPFSVSMSNLNITGGNLPSGNGGGIGNWGNLTLKNSSIYGNITPAQGGGLYNAVGATFVITGTAIYSNTAASDGGGISNDSTIDSTIQQKNTLTNTTISNNNSGGSGGGIVNRGTLTVNASTITANTSTGNGGGINAATGTFNIKDTLIGGNFPASSTYADCAGNVNSNGYNLIQKPAGCILSGDTATNILNSPNLYLDSSLKNNGGPTSTYALLAGSPAIDAGICSDSSGTTINVDQRGVTRPQGPACDIGAFEKEFVASPSLSLSKQIGASGSGPWNSSINVSGLSKVYYQFTVKNTGNVSLSSISVSDPNVSTSSCVFSASLAINGTTTCVVGPVTAAGAAGTYTNTATASGIYSGQTYNSGPSSASYVVTDPVQTGPTYTTTSVFDVTSAGVCTQNNCSLRDAILAANAKPNGSSPDKIQFNISGTGPFTIQLSGPLPAITDPVIIDGYNSGTTQQITLDGTNAGVNVSGLALQASNSQICNLIIQNFSGDGIAINGSNNIVCNDLITHNGGAGVHVLSGTANTITSNVISANTGGGIVLASGTNNSQAAPTLTVATVRMADATPNTDVGGVLTGTPNTTYKIETFNSPTCSGAQGDAILASTTLTTDSNGQGSFLVNVKPALALGAGVTSTATGADGSTSAFSTCFSTQTLNDSWLMAQPLSFNNNSSASVGGKIFQAGQTLWYKFPVLPGGTVQVTINSLPGTMVTLHRDLFKVYNELTNITSAPALAADNLPGGYLPGGYLPGGYLPGGYLPGGYLPGGYLPGGYLPGGYLPGGYLPGGYLPGGYLPGGYLPGGYLPGGYLPGGYLPGNPLPGGYLPELYSGAIRRSLMAITNDQGATTQTITRNTYDLSEDLYVMVSAPASLGSSFTLQVTETNGVCANVPQLPDPTDPTQVIAGSQPTNSNLTTLIVWDSGRMQHSSSATDIATLQAKLAAFATRPEVNGAVIDLAAVENGASKYPRVQQADQIADANPTCITSKNAVAVEIKRVIDAYRAANASNGTTTLQYIVLVGSDYEIPFFRYPDQAGLANENGYVPPVAYSSASEASLRNGQVLGQDAYGAQTDVTRSGFTIPVPQLAVGRLVRTAAEVSGLLDAYTAANGVVTPSSALVTGYDFVADAATKVQNEFSQGLNPANCAANGTCVNVDSLIQPQANGLTGAWTANDLRAKLLPASGKGSDLIFFAGHFSAGGVLAADYSSSLYTSELFNSNVDYTNSLIFALGCHSGYNIPGLDALSYSPVPDWTETFAYKKATLIASTGYAYGDTVLTEYGEQFFLDLSQQIRTGSGPVAIGQALVSTKRAYMAQHPTMEGIDDKTMLETTLYGLPMLKVNLPGERINNNQSSIVASASPVTSGPGASLGLQVGQPASSGMANQVQVNSTVTRHDVPLTNAFDNSSVTATFFNGTNGDTIARPAEPIFPIDLFNVGVNGLTLRGAGFRGGSYTDVLNLTPLTSAATTENSRAHPGFYTDFFYPLQNWAENYFGIGSNGTESLIITPAQYRSNSLSTSLGTFRTYSNMTFRLYYLDQNWPNSSSTILKAAAIAAAPYIHDVSVTDTGSGNLHFQAFVDSDPSAGVQEVWIVYTAKTGPWYGSWQPLDLAQNSQNPKLWEGNLTLPQGVALSDVSYFVQAANGAGTVSLVDPSLKSLTGAATSIQFVGTLPSPSPFGAPVSIQVQLTSGGVPLAGYTVQVGLGSVIQAGQTDANGIASIPLQVLALPGTQTLTASFQGAPGYRPSTAQTDFVVTKQNTQILLNPNPASGHSGDSGLVTATLLDALTQPIRERTVVLTVSDSTGTVVYTQPAITNYLGQVLLGKLNLPRGDYTLAAYYGSLINPGGGQADLSFDGYNPSQASSVIHLLDWAPVATNDSYTTNEDTPLTVAAPGVLGNDTDVEGDPLTAVLVNPPANGNVTLNPDGSFTYIPAANYNGADSFTYQAFDGFVQGNLATVTLNITPVNDPPTFTIGPDQFVVNTAGAQTVTGWATNISPGPANESSQTVSFIVTNSNNALFSTQPAISPDGTLTYAPAPGIYGTATVTVTLKDNGGTANGGVDTSQAQSFNITVDAPPDLSQAAASIPVIWSPDGSYLQESIVGITDPDGDALTITITAIVQDEVVGSTPDAYILGPNSFTVHATRDGSGNGRVYYVFFTVTDGHGNSYSGKVRIDVPHDQGPIDDTIDNGPPYYNSLVPGP